MVFRLVLSTLLAVTLPGPATAQAEEEIVFAARVLANLQYRSFRDNREYCGYLARDGGNRLIATKPRRGKANACYLGALPAGLETFATYHTHAGYDPGSYDEIPSTDDLRSDNALGLDGYVSTPGGRLWFSEGSAMQARLVCGIGCLPQDPRYRPDRGFKVRLRYGIDDLAGLMDD